MQAAALTPVYETLERPLIPVLVALERAGVRIDTGVLAGQAARLEAELDERAERIYGIAGERFNINSPKQLGDVLFVKLQLPALKRTGAAKTPSTAQDVLEELALDPRSAARGDRLARPAEAEGHVSRRAAVAGASDDRPRPHAVQPDDGGHGPALEPRSEPAERADPHRAGPRDPPRLHRRARLAADLGRLLADRAARAGAPLRRSEPVGSVSAERGHPRPHRAQGVRRAQRAVGARAAAARQDHQLRAALREDGVHAVARHRRHDRSGEGVHRRLLRRLPRRARVPRRHHRGGQGQGLRRDALRPPPQRPGHPEPQRHAALARPSASP